MEAADLGDDFTSLEEQEDLEIEAAKFMDTEKLQQLGVDLDFPDVATPFAVGDSIFGRLATRPKHTSTRSACTGDVSSTVLHSVCTTASFGKFSSSTISVYASASMGIGAELLNSLIMYVCSPAVSLQEIKGPRCDGCRQSSTIQTNQVADVILLPVFVIC